MLYVLQYEMFPKFHNGLSLNIRKSYSKRFVCVDFFTLYNRVTVILNNKLLYMDATSLWYIGLCKGAKIDFN
jgi:hypothetical protein